jgi:hypothetical protein
MEATENALYLSKLLCTFSNTSNILPYYSTFTPSAYLMKCLCKKTSFCWTKHLDAFKNIFANVGYRRIKLVIHEAFTKNTAAFLLENLDTLGVALKDISLFVKISSSKQFDALIEFIEMHQDWNLNFGEILIEQFSEDKLDEFNQLLFAIESNKLNLSCLKTNEPIISPHKYATYKDWKYVPSVQYSSNIIQHFEDNESSSKKLKIGQLLFVVGKEVKNLKHKFVNKNAAEGLSNIDWFKIVAYPKFNYYNEKVFGFLSYFADKSKIKKTVDVDLTIRNNFQHHYLPWNSYKYKYSQVAVQPK